MELIKIKPNGFLLLSYVIENMNQEVWLPQTTTTNVIDWLL